MDISKITMPEDQKQKCHTIIHGAAVAAGGAGSGLAQVPMADSAIITPIQIGMIIALGKVFDQKITKSAANAILSGMVASFAGRTASQLLVGWLPLVGNAVNAATAASLTELVGWNAAEQFYKNQLNSINYEVYDGKERTQVDSKLPDENTDRYCQLEKRAEEFLRGRKSKQENREEYNALLNDIEYELDTVSNEHLLNIYDKLLSGKIEPPKESTQLFQKFFSDEQIGAAKRTQNSNRACEINVYNVFTLEEAGEYRVTAKVNYSPIHVGDTFALLVDNKPTNEKITVLQIGFGAHQWEEKEPDTIVTLIVSSNFEYASALLNQRFIYTE